MRISDCMSRNVCITHPDTSLQAAARAMSEIDAGILPVSDGDRLVGMVTDRDIALRGLGKGMGPSATVRDVMSSQVLYCFEDQDSSQVLENMGEIQVRRLAVLDHDKRLVGIVSLSDLACDRTEWVGRTLNEITRPSGLHSQLSAADGRFASADSIPMPGT